MQATCSRIMFPGDPFPKGSAPHPLGAPAQAGRERRRSRSRDSGHSQQAALPAEQRGLKLPSPTALGVLSPSEQKEGEILSPSRSPHTQRQVELSEQNSAMIVSSSGCAGGIAMRQGIGRFRVRHNSHSSADTPSPEGSAENEKIQQKLFGQGAVPQEAQQKGKPFNSDAGGARAAPCAGKGHEEELHSDTDVSCLAEIEERRLREEPHLEDVRVSPVRSDGSAASTSFYSPTQSEPVSEPGLDRTGKDLDSFTFPRPRPSQGATGNGPSPAAMSAGFPMNSLYFDAVAAQAAGGDPTP